MKKTQRGFLIYGQVTDALRQKVRVQESSEVGRPRAWIFAEDAGGKGAIMHLGLPQAVSPYLSRAHARRLAVALLRFANGEGQR